MARRTWSRWELQDRWRVIQEEQDDYDGDPSPIAEHRIRKGKEQWFADTLSFLMNLPNNDHIWCTCYDLMGPLIETFHTYKDENHNSPLKLVWEKISQEMAQCIQCVCRHHQTQEDYISQYEPDTVIPLLQVLQSLDKERVTEHLKKMNARILHGEYDPEQHSLEVISLTFEVLMFPTLFDDPGLIDEFQIFIEAIDDNHEVALAGNQQYPGVYALFFLKSGRARAIGLRLAGRMGKLRGATDLEPLQPLLRKYIVILETEVLPSTLDASRSRIQTERLSVWLGIKTLLRFLEPPAFVEGILERYPIFLSIVLNQVSDDTPEFSYSVTCLRLCFEMLGCKLWLRTSISPSMMRNTLLGQCFHTQNEKSHKELFDLFIPFLQSLEALQDGEHEKQRRHFLYFLLYQVTRSSNFSLLMRKTARKIALHIIHRGYKMNPPCPPFECAHMWGPPLVCSLKDTSLHNSLRQPAFDLIQTIIISDAAALISLKLNMSVDVFAFDEEPFSHDVEEYDDCIWREFSLQGMLASSECKEWICIPMLWNDVFADVDPSILPISFSKAVFWVLSHLCVVVPDPSIDSSVSINEWLLAHGAEIMSYFQWEVPNGSDAGGDGKGSRNSVKASLVHSPLLRTLQRLSAHFIIQFEQRELLRQWTWEPRMAESLILLLLDPNDILRKADRVILEHVSKARGLTPGFRFLCSSLSSQSALYFGLKFAIKQVQVDSIRDKFHNMQHLFFITCKLLKEVVTSPNKQSSNPHGNLDHIKFSSGGGFLRQPFSDSIKAYHFESSPVTVDIPSWDKFNILLSTTIWPSIIKCLVEGKEFIDRKDCQMTCIRFLETIPIVSEKLWLFADKPYESSLFALQNFFSYKWLRELVDWGASCLPVTVRHWKQCLHSLLCLFATSYSGKLSCEFDAIQAIISGENVALDILSRKVGFLSVSLSKDAPCTADDMISRREPFSFELVTAKRKSNLKLQQSKHVIGRDKHDVINLSDDENEEITYPDLVISSRHRSANIVHDDSSFLDVGNMSSSDSCIDSSCASLLRAASTSRSQLKEAPPQYTSIERSDCMSYCKQVSSEVQFSAGSTVSSFTNWKEKDLENEEINPRNGNNVFTSIKEPDSTNDKLLSLPVCSQPSGEMLASSISNPNIEPLKDTTSIERIIFDAGNDPLECALDQSSHVPVIKKLSISAPRRKVVQLQMPSTNISCSSSKIDCLIRSKPPKLDGWYRSILEIDYFSSVGLSSSRTDKYAMLANLKAVPLCFTSSDHYLEIFRPLVLEEFRAQLHNSYSEMSSDDINSSRLSIISVEIIDDFHIIRGRPDEDESSGSRAYSENDLVLLTKEPLQNTAQQIYALGKVDKREKNDKNRATILVIKFYFPSQSSRLVKVKSLLIVRSKWFLSRVMNMTPQLREFQALSSLHVIPMVPVILNPTVFISGVSECTKNELLKLPQPLQKVLGSAFNFSQCQAVCGAIKALYPRSVVLIQGPPGTGKTRTIVAIVSSLIALPALSNCFTSRTPKNVPVKTCSTRTNPGAVISGSISLAKVWQDAALAKQMSECAPNVFSEPTEHSLGGRILICAQSNAAVDELVSRINEGLYGRDGKVYKPYLVRIGNVRTVHPNSLPCFIDTLVEQRLGEHAMNQNLKNDSELESSSSLRARLEKLLDNIRYFESKRAQLVDVNTKHSVDHCSLKEGDLLEATIPAKLNKLYAQKRAIGVELANAQSRERKASEESRALKFKIRKAILREAHIVLSTLSGCGGDLYEACFGTTRSNRFRNFSEQALFDVVIVDEAAQALEPATLIPLQLLKSNGTKCIMVGDPKQLPATVLSNAASKFLYECSMFERLQRAGYPVIMLTEQYRMHPEICKFPSLHFYEGKLVNGSQMANKSAPFHENSHLGPYLFFDVTDGREHHRKDLGSLSTCNESEVKVTVSILKLLKKRYPSEFLSLKLGIVTPYKSQRLFLHSQCSKAFGPEVTSEMEFNTVDGFQGREVDILILSTVRASDSTANKPNVNSNSIGFVADVRRMNVALTRARFSLWIVGNADTLKKNTHWNSLIQDAIERSLFISVSKPYESISQSVYSSYTGNINRAGISSKYPEECGKARVVASGDEHIRTDFKGMGKRKMRIVESKMERSKSKSSGGSESKAPSESCPKDKDPLENRCLQKSKDETEHNRSPMENNKQEMSSSIVAAKSHESGAVRNRKHIVANKKGYKAGDDMEVLPRKAKGVCKTAEKAFSSNLVEKGLPNLKTDQRKTLESNVNEDKVASRKRQRNEIDALLTSSLIPVARHNGKQSMNKPSK